MSPTERETLDARRLGESLLEFMLACSEGAAKRSAASHSAANRIAAPATPAAVPPVPVRPVGDDAERPPALLGAREAAKYLAISTGTLFNHSAPRGPIPVVRLAARVMYSVKDLDAVVERLRVLPPDAPGAGGGRV